jgi:predicted alpha/beta hydrolase family esterase
MNSAHVLILPGWQNSGPAHWQSRWEAAHGYVRVPQHDWERPRRGDWLMQLEEAVLQCDAPALLVAHSLGCIQVAAWAAHSQNTHRVKAALLVAPGDVEREAMRPLLPGWSPIERRRLPFQSVLVASRDDPHCSFEKAQSLARDWGAERVDIGQAGHINADSGLGDWPQGHALLQRLMN